MIDKTQPPRHEGDYDADSKSFKSPPAVQFLARVRNCPGVYGFAFEQVPFDLPVRRSAPLLKEASFKFFYDVRLSNFSFQFSLPCAARSFRLIFTSIRYDLAPFQVFKFRSPCGLPPFKFVGLSWQFLTPIRCSTKSTVSE